MGFPQIPLLCLAAFLRGACTLSFLFPFCLSLVSTTTSSLISNTIRTASMINNNIISMKSRPNWVFVICVALSILFQICYGQDYNDPAQPTAPAPPPGQEECNGIFLTYTFTGREKEVPFLKNASAQAWAFKATASILNAGSEELKAWKMFVGFNHREILVSATGATIADGADFPSPVGNGTTFIGNPMADLKTAIDTAGDYTQIGAQIEIKGTQFGLMPPAVPMPKSLKLLNDGYQCPEAKKEGSYMHVCCVRDPKYKAPPIKKNQFAPRQKGDLSISFDVTQAYANNYLAQVTIDNLNPLGRLDNWNLTWEWQNGEFIYTMRGAYTHRKSSADCIYGPAGKFYKELDFSTVMNCEKKPVISDLPPTLKDDEKVGKLPSCCRNGSLLPKFMNETKAKSVFQVQVFKLPPNNNRTAFVPPMKWDISGVLNPTYKCGPPVRVDPTEFPDPSGIQAKTTAVASWQIICNITKPEEKAAKCCVTFSAYYNQSIIPCPTCACGCPNPDKCNPDAKAMLLPSEALLVPFDNRTDKAVAWAGLKHLRVPKPLPCSDNCGVSINWHINSDYKDGWSARVTLFNWGVTPFEDWFTAVRLDKAFDGYENVYSFNGTKPADVNKTIVFTGLLGLNYLVPLTNGSNPAEPKVPGKQQSVLSFSKKKTPNINIVAGQGFPSKVYFNGEECALPKEFPLRDAGHRSPVNLMVAVFVAVMTFVAMQQDRFH